MSARRGAKSPRVRAWLRRGVLAVLLLLALPIPAVLLLRFVHPPTTGMMLVRTAQRAIAGDRPVYPRRTIVVREDVAPALRRAVLAAEDDRFYLHHGFDFVEIGNALEDRRAGRRMRGASTISQQVARNVFLWEGGGWVRKGLEAWVTIWLELFVPKDRILDLYVNLAEWGDGIFGIEAGAQHHYGKSARRLTRTESARLAAILPAPRRWSPNGRVAAARASALLPRMQQAVARPEGLRDR